jgi:hypothetical protein
LIVTVARSKLLALLALGASTPAWAQDLETRAAPEKSSSNPVDVEIGLETEWHEASNLDFRPLDESSDQAILDSDDRMSFAYTDVSVGVVYRPDDGPVDLRVVASHRGLWGNDQIGGSSPWGGWVYFGALAVDWFPDADSTRTRLTVGRDFLEIGGLGGTPDPVLADVVDLVRLDVGIGGVATLVLIPMNVMAFQTVDNQITFLQTTAQGDTSPYPMRGDLSTRRTGGMFVLDGLSVPFEARAYAFYTDVGAFGSGADITYAGSLGNFADNDWVFNTGARAQVTAGPVVPFVGFDMSMGIDRKELVANDVDANGWAITGGAALDTGGDDTAAFRATAVFHRALGSAYGTDGLQYSHGFVGLKGTHVGGMLTQRYLGWHAAPYVGRMGLEDDPHEPDRKAGTQVIQAGVGLDLPQGFSADVGFWNLADTSVSFVDLANIELIDPPYGYSREEFAAQERLGASLGTEIDLSLSYSPVERLTFSGTGAMLMPGEYYAIEIARVAGDQLGGEATAFGAYLGLRADF